jgi:hypothetical protein
MRELLMCTGDHPIAALLLFELGLFCRWLGMKSYGAVKRLIVRRRAQGSFVVN